jgi:hypothetical protein
MTSRKKLTLLFAILAVAWLQTACEQKNTYVEPPPLDPVVHSLKECDEEPMRRPAPIGGIRWVLEKVLGQRMTF